MPSSPTINSSSHIAENNANTAIWNGYINTVWNKLIHKSTAQLLAMQSKTSDPTNSAWIALALISKQNSTNTQQLARKLLVWREQNPKHPGNRIIPDNPSLNQLVHASPPKHIAVLLPQHGLYRLSAQTVREGFLSAYYSNLPHLDQQEVKFYDTTQTQDISSLYQKAVTEGADVVIGPLTKDTVNQLRQHSSFKTPVIALNYSLNPNETLPNNFYEYGLLPEDEVSQIANRARESGLSRALVIAAQNPWGKRLADAFSAQWSYKGGTIQDAWYYSERTNFAQEVAKFLKVDIDKDKKLMKEDNHRNILEQQRRHDFDVIFLFAQPQEARVIVPLLRYYYASDTPIYATSAVYSGKPNPINDVDLNGVIICDIPWHIRMGQRWSDDYLQSNRLFAVGQDAYLLSQNLPRMMQLTYFPIYGTTGALSMSVKQQVHRRLPCTTIQNGQT